MNADAKSPLKWTTSRHLFNATTKSSSSHEYGYEFNISLRIDGPVSESHIYPFPN